MWALRRPCFLMAPDPGQPQARGADASDPTLNRLLGFMSVFTMAMTVPQVWTVWVSRETAGVSLWSWGAYLAAAVLWFWHGLRAGDRNIYLPCIGWAILDAAVIAGVVLHAG
jgi:uncharacterized protein with PQ loop repeat